MRRTCRVAALSGFLLIVFGTPALGQNPRSPLERTLERQRRSRLAAMQGTTELLQRWMEAWNGDDARGLAELYTEEAVLFPPGSSSQIRGRDAIGRYLEGSLAEAGEIRLQLADFDGAERLAYAVGTFIYTSGARVDDSVAAPAERGVFLLVVRRDGDEWRIRFQLFQLPSPFVE